MHALGRTWSALGGHINSPLTNLEVPNQVEIQIFKFPISDNSGLGRIQNSNIQTSELRLFRIGQDSNLKILSLDL